MKQNDKKASSVRLGLFLLLFLPGGFFVLGAAILLEPIRYLRFRRSHYRRDFPTRYKFPCYAHPDADSYTVIKEHGLPIRYFKHPNDYDLRGFFVWNDVLLDFSEPFVFDKKSSRWLSAYGIDEDSDIEPSAEDGLPIGDASEPILQELRQTLPDVSCDRVVWFVRADKIRNARARNLLACRDDVVLYTKKTLAAKLRALVQKKK